MNGKHYRFLTMGCALAASLSLIGLSGCPSPSSGPNLSGIYVAGSYNDPNNVACYWKDGTRHDLDTGGATRSFATAIVVTGGNIYAAGYYGSGGPYVGCYWVNGVRTDLPGTGANVYSMFVSDGTVYTSGYYNDTTYGNVAAYWVGNASPTRLSTNVSSAQSIFFSGTTVYTAGWDDVPTAAYWTDTTIHSLTTTGQANSIYVSGSTVYAAGQDQNTGRAVYWPGVTTATDLTSAGGNANSITYSGGKTYAAGVDGSNACYWTNATETPLETTGTSVANSIFLSGSTIYTAGQYGTSACYWTGTTRTTFTDANSLATSIFVVP